VYPKTMSTRVQLGVCLAGPVFVFLFFFGSCPLAQFVPPPSPNASAATIGHLYRDDRPRCRVGLLLMTMSTCPHHPLGPDDRDVDETRGGSLFAAHLRADRLHRDFVARRGADRLVWSVAAFRPEVTALATTRMLTTSGGSCIVHMAAVQHLGTGRRYRGSHGQAEEPAFPRWVAICTSGSRSC